MKYIRMRWAGHVACKRQMRNGYKFLVAKLEGKAVLERHRYRWKNNSKM
jgi:hypothetical protein